MIDKEGAPYFYISDLRDQSGVATFHLPFEVTYAMYDDDGPVDCELSSDIEVIDILDENGVSLFNDEAHATYNINNKCFDVSFNTNSYRGDTCVLVFTTTSVLAKAFTIGSRNTSEYGMGGYSIAAGYNCTSSEVYSFAEGYETISRGIASHAEGWQTEACARGSHTEGYMTLAASYAEGAHAEGYMTIAIGDGSHAEGENTIARGNNSHAQNENHFFLPQRFQHNLSLLHAKY